MSISSQQSPTSWQLKSQLQVWVPTDWPLHPYESVQHSVNPAATQEPIGTAGCIAASGGKKWGRARERMVIDKCDLAYKLILATCKKKQNKQTKANQWSYLLQQLYCVLVLVAAKLGQQEPMLRRKCWRLAYRLLETLDLASCLCLYSFENLMLNFKMWMTVATDHWLRGTSSCCISIMKVLLFFSMQIE